MSFYAKIHICAAVTWEDVQQQCSVKIPTVSHPFLYFMSAPQPKTYTSCKRNIQDFVSRVLLCILDSFGPFAWSQVPEHAIRANCRIPQLAFVCVQCVEIYLFFVLQLSNHSLAVQIACTVLLSTLLPHIEAMCEQCTYPDTWVESQTNSKHPTPLTKGQSLILLKEQSKRVRVKP